MFKYLYRINKLLTINYDLKRQFSVSCLRLTEKESKDRKYGQTSSVQKILKIKDFVDYLVYGAFGVAIYYAYQRYKKFNELKQDIQAELVEIKQFKAKFYKIKDHYLSEMILKSLKPIKDFETRKDDVWIASFPKSGTTWLQEIAYLIVNDCDFIKAKSKTIDERSPFLEFPTPGLDFTNKMQSPRVLKTHLPYEFLPDDIENKSKVVYIVRNPKDTCVSLYYFIKMIPHFGFDGTIQEMIKLFTEGKVPYGPWPQHVDSFTSRKNVLVIHYEDLQKNPKDTIKALCKFIGKNLNESQLDAIIEHCSFENMKQNSSVNYEWNKMLGLFSSNGTFFRKGQIGDWLNYFSPKTSQEMDRIVKADLKYEKKFDFGISEEDMEKIHKAAEININKIE